MLYLFDIDGTLVDTGGAGMQSLNEATLSIFGEGGPQLDLAGATDLGIIHGLHQHFEIDATPDRIDAYFTYYHERLEWNLAHGTFEGCLIDGVSELLQALSQRDQCGIGLLTGNTADGAKVKVTHYGVANYFAFGAYGSDHQDRNQLGPIALKRAQEHLGREFDAKDTWVIGDTPKDIACAHAMGARCLAVATGSFTADQLTDFGADKVTESLAEAIDWI